MDLGLAGRVAIVGGASHGLGRACAEGLAEEGVHVVICSRDRAAIEKAAHDIHCATGADVVPVVCDQTCADDIDRLVKRTLDRFHRIDVLVNNTGGPPLGRVFDHDDEAWQAAFDGILMSVVRLCRMVIPRMRQKHWRRIVNNTSFTVREPAERLVLSNALRAGVASLLSPRRCRERRPGTGSR